MPKKELTQEEIIKRYNKAKEEGKHALASYYKYREAKLAKFKEYYIFTKEHYPELLKDKARASYERNYEYYRKYRNSPEHREHAHKYYLANKDKFIKKKSI